MNTLLHIDSSASPRGSISRKLTAELSAAWRRTRAGEKVIYRDLDKAPIPGVGHSLIAARAAAPGTLLSDDQKRALALSNGLVDELFEADTFVLGVPVSALSVPATFKAWLDQVAGADRVLRGGGALKGRKVLVLATLDAADREAAHVFHEGYLRQVLGTLGITDVTWVPVVRVANQLPEAAAVALEEARMALRATLERWNADEEETAREILNKAAA